MKIGFALPQFHRQAHGVAQTAAFASAIEEAGGASLWVGDRNLAAVRPVVGYGGRGNTIPEELNPAADPFVLLGVAAAATSRVLLGSHVLVAPLYPPVQLARSLTTIDLISGGRLLPGFGVGWSPEEYQAAGLDFTVRGARMEELLDALHAIWTTDPAQYEGDQISVPEHHSPLKPARQPRPPFYLGALSERALRRVARRGDGWLPLIAVPSYVDVDGLVAQRSLLDELARQNGRDPHAIDTVLRVNIDAGTSTEKVAETVKEVHERTGIDHFMIDSMYDVDTVEGSLEHARQILELVGKG
ncbi:MULTISPECIES: TIGR03619 family F420-dependent LLM class oxidoreductase [unclassified Streptomyces]|uniref:TIGR03619 family F420-dependent LLM class oxidoreductase n=1 Tax=unclassified Streptomyces TaxID=2593676 RepID=UPI001661B5E8|nr:MULTISPECIES: TIGR03619 family F420-dependent LLM class oxidoreductase [unclassified Streptomyces]MBD0841588.1 TIGR03619 family F420-dependent LLM class oxidoreductase [Streptomyces sp. TRM68416]